jgi:hypothetical protein
MAMLGSASGVSSAMAGLGQISGALGHIALGVAAIAALAKSLDDSGTYHRGATASYSAAGGLQGSAVAANGWTAQGTFGRGSGIEFGSETQELVSGLTKSIVGILDSTAVTFGQAAGYAAATGFADDTSKDGAFGSLLIKRLDQTIVDWEATRASDWAPKTFSDGEAGRGEYLAAIAADVRTALDQMGLPTWAQGMLDNLGDAPTLEQLTATVTQINATQAALARMGDTLAGFGAMGDSAHAALIRAAGGIDALAANASTYYDGFYSEAEKTATVTRQVAEALAKVGVEMPASREAFRAEVEKYQAILAEVADPLPVIAAGMGVVGDAVTSSINTLNEARRDEAAAAVAALLGVSGAFASVVPAAEAATEAIEEVTEATSITLAAALNSLRNPLRDIEDIANGIFALENELFDLQNAGNTDALRQKQLAGLTETEVALQRHIWALQDEATAAEAAAVAASAVAAERAGLEKQLLQALGETAALRAQELAALDPSNRALQQQVWAVTDAQSAIQSLTADIDRWAGVMAQASETAASIRIAMGGADTSTADLWATARSSGTGAEDRLSAINELLRLINGGIDADTQEAARSAQDTIEQAGRLRDLQRRAYDEQIASAERLLDIGQQLRDYVDSLRVGDMSTLTPLDKLQEAQRQYEATLAAARGGDQDALGRLQDKASTYLDLARQFDPEAYNRLIFDSVTGALDSLGSSLISDNEQAVRIATRQLDLLDSINSVTNQTAEVEAAARVISESNLLALTELLDLATAVEADAVIARASAEAQRTAQEATISQIRDGISSTLPATLTQNNQALMARIDALNDRIAQMEAGIVQGLSAVATVTAQSSASNAATVADAVEAAVSHAAGVPEIV